MQIGTKEIAGTEVEIHVDISGRWVASLPVVEGENNVRPLGYGDTLDDVLAQARTKLAKSKVRVEVPFITSDKERAVAYGRHAGNRDVLYRVVGGDAARYSYGLVLRGDTPQSVIDNIAALEIQQKRAYKEQRRLESDWELDLRDAVDKAIAAK